METEEKKAKEYREVRTKRDRHRLDIRLSVSAYDSKHDIIWKSCSLDPIDVYKRQAIYMGVMIFRCFKCK